MNAAQIGEVILQRRKKLGLRQQELADLSEVNINTIVAIEKGEHNPKLSTLLAVGNVLGLELIVQLRKIDYAKL